MTLTTNQIQNLYTFTKQHYVEYYDLQSELVDHLANDIEQMWLEQPKMPFEDAKLKAFKKFGIFGFMDAIEQKQKAMNKRYLRYLWAELKQWFKLPQIIITTSIFLLFYTAFSTSYAAYFSLGFYIMIGVWVTYKSIGLRKVFKLRKQKSDKKWLLEEIIFKQASGTALIFLSQLHSVFTVSDSFLKNIYAVVGFSIIFMFMVFINYVSFYLLPNKAEKLLNETYPEFCL